MDSGVYFIRNTVNGKIYVGSTVNLDDRKSYHWTRLARGIHDNSRLQSEWSRDIFEFIVQEFCKPDIRKECEQYWMDHFWSWDEGYGYNISRFAEPDASHLHNDKVFRKSAASRKGKIRPYIYKPLLQIKDGAVVGEWESGKRAASELSIPAANISAVLNNRRSTAGGFSWTYKTTQ